MLCCSCLFFIQSLHKHYSEYLVAFKFSNLLRETEFITTTAVLLNFQMVFNHCFLFSFLFLRLVNPADSFCSPFATLRKTFFSSPHANQPEREDPTPKRHFAPFIFALLLFAIVSLYPSTFSPGTLPLSSPCTSCLLIPLEYITDGTASMLCHWTKIYWMGAKRLDISMYFSFLWLKTTVFDLVY